MADGPRQYRPEKIEKGGQVSPRNVHAPEPKQAPPPPPPLPPKR